MSAQKALDAREAMLSAGHARIRPVLMTATAMIIGMLPMSLGLGEGGEQNAPLGRAVIGGLLLATVNTLFVVPIVYSLPAKETSRRSRTPSFGSGPRVNDATPPNPTRTPPSRSAARTKNSGGSWKRSAPAQRLSRRRLGAPWLEIRRRRPSLHSHFLP